MEAPPAGRASPDSDGFGYSGFEPGEPLVPPEEAVAAAIAEAEMRRRSSRHIPDLDQVRVPACASPPSLGAPLLAAAAAEWGPVNGRNAAPG